jgi:hypothetical protein
VSSSTRAREVRPYFDHRAIHPATLRSVPIDPNDTRDGDQKRHKHRQKDVPQQAARTGRVTLSRYTGELAPNSSWLPGATDLRAPITEPVLLHRSRGLHARDSLPEEARRFGEFVQLSRDTAASKISSPRQRHRRQRPRGQRPLQRPWRSLSRCRAVQKSPANVSARGSIEALSPSAGCARFDTDTGITFRCHARNDDAGGRSLPCLRPHQRHPPRPDAGAQNRPRHQPRGPCPPATAAGAPHPAQHVTDRPAGAVEPR